MSVISEKFNAKITSLKNEYEVNKGIVHQGVKGGINENELSTLIKEVVPKKYQISSGIIENSDGEQSNETDILIYDDEILPLYMRNDLTFVPVEAVKYNFEVKSTLNATELKTTINKFERFKSIGGYSPTVLFSFSTDLKGSELERLKNNDSNFFVNPAISVICTSNKSYYFKSVREHLLKDYLSNSEFMKLFQEASGLDFDGVVEAMRDTLTNDQALSQMSRSQFAQLIQGVIQINNHKANVDDKELTVNGVKYNEVTFRVHKWIGIEIESNEVELSLLSGISNSLSLGNFGQYLLNSGVHQPKVFAVCYEDMWGNLSCQDFDVDGLNYDTDKVSFSFQTSKESSQVIFHMSDLEDG
ncbi:DUF6602 domain-containing protein [Pseudoalteromonas sp. BDTF-M6]|uniref:DUF6602 domain-containing protein n=1 Tax=Pseudoalteromonas sp. BDTF-M6 TaxID=2796132 RepID=UPI001BAF883E|nr:DUF6602 domain-containing protein [Pseudoalteromonas sp. BDTF-M6]MBS3796856.1 hypothetical protein [Pseudoalteromonas sp. BDTF-M6]